MRNLIVLASFCAFVIACGSVSVSPGDAGSSGKGGSSGTGAAGAAGIEADAAFEGAAGVVVLGAVAGEYLDGAVVHLDGAGHG